MRTILIALMLSLALVESAAALAPSSDHYPPLPLKKRMVIVSEAIRALTECYVHALKEDPRLTAAMQDGNITDLIVDATEKCVGEARIMIMTWNRLYGAKNGMQFFHGPYLKDLPKMILKQLR